MKIPESARIPDLFDFDPDMMKPLFDIGREFGRNPSSWVAAPSPGENASRGSSICYLNCGVSGKQLHPTQAGRE
jgi:hypothetical protein